MNIKQIVYVTLLMLCGIDLFGWNFNVVNSDPLGLGCQRNNIKLLAILNLLCNTTQIASIQQRDACYGCFFRAGNLAPGPTQLLALSQCATIYLNATAYQICAQNLATVLIGIRPTTVFKIDKCYTGYCDFVRCVRRTNANVLVNACFLGNLVNRDFNRVNDRINFFTNTTACILARTRCNAYNPITGELQQQLSQVYPVGLTNNVGTGGYYSHNSLQISPNGDIKIVAFPASVIVGDLFCSNSATLEQSTYDGQTCIFT